MVVVVASLLLVEVALCWLWKSFADAHWLAQKVTTDRDIPPAAFDRGLSTYEPPSALVVEFFILALMERARLSGAFLRNDGKVFGSEFV